VEVLLPHTEYAVATYYILAPSEASSNLARFDGVQYGFRAKDGRSLMEMYEKTRAQGFGDEAKRRIILGTYALSSGYYDADYLKALKIRTLIKQDFDAAFERCDCLLTPTAPTPAFRIGEKINDPLTMYLSDIYTIGANLAGIPALSVPCGWSREGLPIGMQLLGKPFDEALLFRVADAYELNRPWQAKTPSL
jgi:aspartyl-tRNA(Asn)/glutamyl-tRNA(Gln) amidotransferase subunit A